MGAPDLFSIQQIIPSEVCLACDVCCRFEEQTTSFTPAFLPQEAENLAEKTGKFDRIGKVLDIKPPAVENALTGCSTCRFFESESNGCEIYREHPLDCQLYPFMVCYQPERRQVELVLDIHCPFFRDQPENRNTPQFSKHVEYLRQLLEHPEVIEAIGQNREFIATAHPMAESLAALPGLSRHVGLVDDRLRRLSLEDRAIFEPVFRSADTALGSRHFAYLFSWSSAFHVVWQEIAGAFCVFAGRGRDFFLFYPPLGRIDEAVIDGCRSVLCRLNQSDRPEIRICHATQSERDALERLGFETTNEEVEYVYSRRSIADLSGGKYKSRRGDVNRFQRLYPDSVSRRFEAVDGPKCLALYRRWSQSKITGQTSETFLMMIEDSYFAHKKALFHSVELALEGIILQRDDQIVGYSLGTALSSDGWGNLFEVVDPELSGGGAYVFSQLARFLERGEWINTLDASELPGLAQVKKSYQPSGLLNRYTLMQTSSPLGLSC